jgi:hypothetical protein
MISRIIIKNTILSLIRNMMLMLKTRQKTFMSNPSLFVGIGTNLNSIKNG